MAIFAKVKGFITGHVWLTLFGATIIGGGVVFVATRPTPPPPYETVPVERRDLVEEVSVTGQVKPAEEVNLAFEVSGKLVAVSVDVGDKVESGQVLASIGSSQLLAQLSAARANVASAQSVLQEYQLALSAEQSKLDELKLGTRPEEIVVAQTKVDNAKRAVQDAKAHLASVIASGDQAIQSLYAASSDLLNDGYSKADDAMVRDTDALFSDSFSNKDQLSFAVADHTIKSRVEAARQDALVAVSAFSSRLAVLGSAQADIDDALTDAVGYVATVLTFLNDANMALLDAVGLTESQLTTYKSNVSLARTNVISASVAINSHIQDIADQRVSNSQAQITAQNQINDAESVLRLAESELLLKQSGSLPDQIRAQEARVKQSELVLNTQQSRVWQAYADVERINAELGQYAIRSPLRGIVTKQDARVGEIIAARTPIITVISQSTYEITANVPEADIAKMMVGDQATLTLDAYGDRAPFAAAVVHIDPAQTVIEGVTTYKVTFQFLLEDERIRSGMTANIIVVTDQREDALSVPYRAVIRRDNEQFVRLYPSNAAEGAGPIEIAVETGIVSVDGFIEILSGVKEGDPVVIRTNVE